MTDDCFLAKKPNLSGLVDRDILRRFEGSAVSWEVIINAQLIKTNKELIRLMKERVNNG